MSKKHFVWFGLIGSLAFFMLLPLFNYTIDRWRVLHGDYLHQYTGIEPNKAYLKMVYLLKPENKNRFDTIVMGSSRGGYIDTTRISEHAYNMKHNFGISGVYLHNLKILLAHGVRPKELWIGINDYVIWKDPADHDKSFQRRVYRDDWVGYIKTMLFYLFKKPDYKDVDIVLGRRYYLVGTTGIIDPEHHDARKKESVLKANPKAAEAKLEKLLPARLGYEDSHYRIEKAVDEIAAIKQLCDEHNITLVPFIYPPYYRTYLQYNQKKIEKFKRKLAKRMAYYDFYGLSPFSFDPTKWNDTSHFVPSIGDYIIHEIQSDRHLVSSKNIEVHLKKVREGIKLFLSHKKRFYRFNAHMDLSELDTLFALGDSRFSYRKNDQAEIKQERRGVVFHVTGNDPWIKPFGRTTDMKRAILTCRIASPHAALFQIFFKPEGVSAYSEKDSFVTKLRKGKNAFNLLFPSEYLNNGTLRIDIVDKPGTYTIEELSIHGIAREGSK